MKVLIIHNEYGRYSGEEAAVDYTGQMLESNGHKVQYFRKSTAAYRNTVSGKLKVFFSGIYSFSGVREVEQLLHQVKPDVINIHNLYPFISPAALFACKAAGIPVVMTVHNYRLICPTGLFMRNGKPCEHCLTNKNEWSCIRYNCERNMAKSLNYALRNYIARVTGAYQKNIERFICVTDFQKAKLTEAGFDNKRISVIPNSIKKPANTPAASADYVAYAGRLSYEKGWDMLLTIAQKNPDILFHVAGAVTDGLLNFQETPNILFRGQLSANELAVFYNQARFLVIPSRCYEGFPLTAIEAMAYGKPLIAPDHGAFSEIIGRHSKTVGLLFRPNDCNDLENKIRELWDNNEQLSILSKNSRDKFSSEYSSDVVYKQWENLLTEVTTNYHKATLK